MAIGICPGCRRRFVIEDARSYQRTCPACLHPMQIPGPATVSPPTSQLHGEARSLWLNDTPLPAHDLGQRVMAALAEAAHQCAVARALRQAVRVRRGGDARSVADEEITRSPALAPEGQEEPPHRRGQGAMGLAEQSVMLVERAER